MEQLFEIIKVFLIGVLLASEAENNSAIEQIFAMAPKYLARMGYDFAQFTRVEIKEVFKIIFRIIIELHLSGLITLERPHQTGRLFVGPGVCFGYYPKTRRGVTKFKHLAKGYMEWLPDDVLKDIFFRNAVTYDDTSFVVKAAHRYVDEILRVKKGSNEQLVYTQEQIGNLLDWIDTRGAEKFGMQFKGRDTKGRMRLGGGLYSITEKLNRCTMTCPAEDLTDEGIRALAWSYAVLRDWYWDKELKDVSPEEAVERVIQMGLHGLDNDQELPDYWRDPETLLAERIRRRWQEKGTKSWNIPIERDIKSAGISIFSLLTHNAELAHAAGMVDGDIPTQKDIYRPMGMKGNVDREAMKDIIMVIPYGSEQEAKQEVAEFFKEGMPLHILLVYRDTVMYQNQKDKVLRDYYPGFRCQLVHRECRHHHATDFSADKNSTYIYVSKTIQGVEYSFEWENCHLESIFDKKAAARFYPSAPLHSADAYCADKVAEDSLEKGYWMQPLFDGYWTHPNYSGCVEKTVQGVLQEFADRDFMSEFLRSIGCTDEEINIIVKEDKIKVTKYPTK